MFFVVVVLVVSHLRPMGHILSNVLLIGYYKYSYLLLYCSVAVLPVVAKDIYLSPVLFHDFLLLYVSSALSTPQRVFVIYSGPVKRAFCFSPKFGMERIKSLEISSKRTWGWVFVESFLPTSLYLQNKR